MLEGAIVLRQVDGLCKAQLKESLNIINSTDLWHNYYTRYPQKASSMTYGLERVCALNDGSVSYKLDILQMHVV